LDDRENDEFSSINQNKYYYEIILFTGQSYNSQAISKVFQSNKC
jgi:hypothetical protein